MGFCENTYREHVDMGSKFLQELKKENTNDSADAPFFPLFIFLPEEVGVSFEDDGGWRYVLSKGGPGSCQMHSLHRMLTNRSEAKSEDLIPIKDRVITGIQRISLTLTWKIKA